MTAAKRALDLALALGGIIALMPVLVVVATLIFLRDGRPILHTSARMKTRDQGFRLIKFRSMISIPDDGRVTGGHKKAYITPLGRWLRRTHLDELPQIWNVIRGEMSLVGPRPPLPYYVRKFPDIYGKVLEQRPGITGLATLILGHRERELLAGCATPEETEAAYVRYCILPKARLDIKYARHSSVCLDLILLWKTFTIVLGYSTRAGRPGRAGSTSGPGQC